MTSGGSHGTQINYALNSLRAIAALLVAVSHLRALFFVDYNQLESTTVVIQAAYLIASLGHPAVIVFFVLSGFWVGGSVLRAAQNGSFRWSKYATARLVRLWLVLLPAIFLTQCLDRLGSQINPTSDIYKGSDLYHTVIPLDGPSQHLGFVDTLGNAFFVQSIHTATLGSNSPLWSLAYEFWYYLLFPAAVLAFSKRYSVRVRILSCSAFFAGCLIAGPEVLILFPAWLIGAALALKQDRIRVCLGRLSARNLRFMRLLVTAALFGCAAVTVQFHFSPILTAVMITLPAAALIALYVRANVQSKHLAFVSRKLSDAAEWSYSLYAIHMPILAFMASFIVPSASGRWQVSASTLFYSLLIFLVLILLVNLVSRATEQKTSLVRDYITGKLKVLSKKENTSSYF